MNAGRRPEMRDRLTPRRPAAPSPARTCKLHGSGFGLDWPARLCPAPTRPPAATGRGKGGPLHPRAAPGTGWLSGACGVGMRPVRAGGSFGRGCMPLMGTTWSASLCSRRKPPPPFLKGTACCGGADSAGPGPRAQTDCLHCQCIGCGVCEACCSLAACSAGGRRGERAAAGPRCCCCLTLHATCFAAPGRRP